MEEEIKEYLLVNAEEYAKFKGINSDFINNPESEEYKQYYDEAISYLQEGGIIQKLQFGGVTIKSQGSWYNEVFTKLKQALIQAIQNKNLTPEAFNHYQTEHSRIRTAAGNNYQNTAYTEGNNSIKNLQTIYNNLGFNQAAIAPNWQTRYKINSSNPTTGDNLGNWTPDDYFSGITDDRRFGREGDFTDDQLVTLNNELKSLGYKYELDPTSKYYLLKAANDNGGETQQGTEPGTEPVTEPGTETKTPTLSGVEGIIGNGRVGNKVNLGNIVNPENLLETAKFINTWRTNKKMRDLYQLKYATPTYVPKHENIFGDEATRQKGYIQAANTQSTAQRIAGNTSDYNTAANIQLQGQQQADKIRLDSDMAYNAGIRETGKSAREREFNNIDEYTKTRNEANERFAAASNAYNTALLGYYNQQSNNINNYIDSILYDYKSEKQDNRAFKTAILDKTYERKLQDDPEVLKWKMQYEKDGTNESYNKYIAARENARRRYEPQYLEQMARIRGYTVPTFNFLKKGGKVDDTEKKYRDKDLERIRKQKRDQMHYNDKKLDRLGRLMYLYAKRTQGKK